MTDDPADTKPDAATPGPAPDATPDPAPDATPADPPAPPEALAETPRPAPAPGPPADPPPLQKTRPSPLRAWHGIARGFISVAAVAAVVLLIVVARGGLGPSAASHPRTPAAAAPGQAALPGLQSTPAPWNPEYRHLPQRLATLGLPDLSDTVFHIHAMLRVFVDGVPVTVPANIGLPDTGNALSPLHTHDASGIIHLESTRRFAFTLGQVFDVWGVVFTRTQLGAYRDSGARTLQIYVNGRPVADGPAYPLRSHDTVVVGFGRPGSFPTNQPGDFSGGL
ncbi:MAG: hypothetical protein ACR2KV_14255 [Solirubrobacteraceae bacterium]